MSDASQAIDGPSLQSLIACHIAAYGRSICGTDPWLSKQLREVREANDATSEMAHVAIDCFEDYDLLKDVNHGGIGWQLFTDGFDLAIKLAALVSRSPLTPNLEAVEEAFNETRSGIARLVESARPDRPVIEPATAEARA